ncbi:conserved hypothetical protein [Gammaproteobacteria bacterium]
MSFSVALKKNINVLEPPIKEVFVTLIDEIEHMTIPYEVEQPRENGVARGEFDEIKGIVKELAEAQQRTEYRMEKLAEAQQRTEYRMEKLAEAQQDLKQALKELSQAQTQTQQEIAQLNHQMGDTRSQVGGLSRSLAYAMENEAYRKLPTFLREHCGINIEKQMIRTFVGDQEINFFAHAQREGQSVLVVGESVLRLDDAGKLKQVLKQIEVVRAHQNVPLVPIIVTHFAHPRILAQAQAKGIIVVQSYEWD